MANIQCGILVTKEWNPVICNNMGGMGGDYIKWKKPGTERQSLIGRI
jgi:hypothetical protein